MPTIVSGNWVSILFFPLGIFLVRGVIRFRKGGPAAMASRESKVDAVILVSAYGLLFPWAIVHTVYEDHETLVKKIARLSVNPSDLTYGLNQLGDGETEHKYFVHFEVSVVNQYGPPRAIDYWGATIETPHGRFQGLSIIPRNRKIPINAHHSFNANADEFCPKATENPIPTGGIKGCWMMLVFPGNPRQMSAEATSITITFRDVLTGKTYEIKQQMPKSGISPILQ